MTAVVNFLYFLLGLVIGILLIMVALVLAAAARENDRHRIDQIQDHSEEDDGK